MIDIKVELIKEGTSPNPEMAIAKAASECYDSEPSINLVRDVLDLGHTSIGEHAKYEFRISGVSRTLSHQLVRKRIGFSYSQRSQRYCNENNFDYVIPNSIDGDLKLRYKRLMSEISSVYHEFIERGIPKEDARFVLPNATHTSLYLSCNQRSLMDFCDKRLCQRAQWEIRKLSNKLKEKVKEISPLLASYLKPQCERLGYCPEGVKSCGRMSTKYEILGS